MTARSTSLIRLSPSTTLGISQLRPPCACGSAATAGTRAVSHPGWARSASSARRVSSSWLFPSVMATGVAPEDGSLMADIFQLLGARLRHVTHAFSRVDAGNGAFAEPVIEAIGFAVLDP